MDFLSGDSGKFYFLYIPYFLFEAVKWISSRAFMENEQFKLLSLISESQKSISESQERTAIALAKLADIQGEILNGVLTKTITPPPPEGSKGKNEKVQR